MQERARAKVNLSLQVLGKRHDGYHTLLSYVAFPDIADQLQFSASDTLRLMVEGEFAAQAGTGDENLVLRAAHTLNAHAGTAHGATIMLTKNIPVGAGLGGGSADAAAALRGLNRFWDLGLDIATLAHIGERLGADVPMCLYSVPLTAGGVGELIAPIKQTPIAAWLVVVHPRVALSTAEVFAAYRMHGTPETTDALAARNDLQATAIGLCPVIGEVIDSLRQHGGGAQRILMSGSGTACFALFQDEAMATACAARMQHHHPDWWIRKAETAI